MSTPLPPGDTRDLWERLGAGELPGGIATVSADSAVLGPRIHTLLEACAARGGRVLHLLGSGEGVFGLPAHVPLDLQGDSAPANPDPFAILSLMRSPEGTPAAYAAQIEQRAPAKRPALVLIECLTTPHPGDQRFAQQLLVAQSTWQAPILIAAHAPAGALPAPPAVERLLCLLYLCGGRVGQDDWRRLVGQDDAPGWIAPRLIGSHRIVTYTRRAAADSAASAFRRLSHTGRSRLAEYILGQLTPGRAYPLPALAEAAGSLDALRRACAPASILLARGQPRGMSRLFRALARAARGAGETRLAATARDSALAALLDAPRPGPARFAALLGRLDLRIASPRLASVLWLEAGQRMVRSKDPQDWERALACFARSRACASAIPAVSDAELQMRLAAIANSEALIALRRRQPDQALRLEQEALAAIQSGQHGGSPAERVQLQVLLAAHAADVDLRLGNLDRAIAQYQHGHALAVQHGSLEARQYVAPNYAKALLHAGRPDEAAPVLEQLLAALRASPQIRLPQHNKRLLQIRLMQAQAYTDSGQPRRAAACYWQILRSPSRLTPALLRGVTENLRRCRALSPRLARRVERIVDAQETLAAQVRQARAQLAVA